MFQNGNSHATPFWSKIHEVTDGQKLFGQSSWKLYKHATYKIKILSHGGQARFEIDKTIVKFIVPGPMYTLQEKYKNQKNKNKTSSQMKIKIHANSSYFTYLVQSQLHSYSTYLVHLKILGRWRTVMKLAKVVAHKLVSQFILAIIC